LIGLREILPAGKPIYVVCFWGVHILSLSKLIIQVRAEVDMIQLLSGRKYPFYCIISMVKLLSFLHLDKCNSCLLQLLSCGRPLRILYPMALEEWLKRKMERARQRELVRNATAAS